VDIKLLLNAAVAIYELAVKAVFAAFFVYFGGRAWTLAKWSWKTYHEIKDHPVTFESTKGFIAKFFVGFFAACAFVMIIFFKIQRDEMRTFVGDEISQRKLELSQEKMDIRVSQLEKEDSIRKITNGKF
jgi:hypothetical protein